MAGSGCVPSGGRYGGGQNFGGGGNLNTGTRPPITLPATRIIQNSLTCEFHRCDYSSFSKLYKTKHLTLNFL